MSIRFGTSGWHAVIADEFTFAGVRTVTEALCIDFEGTDRVAGKRGLPVFETPVGFKYIGELINEEKIIPGGEESAGLSIKGHFPEKDGIPACLLAAEAVAARGASLTGQLNALYQQVDGLESARISVRLTLELMASLPEKLKLNARDSGGRPVVETNRTDGVKFIFCGRLVVAHAPVGH
jgi:phosphoglucomutase